MEIAIIVAMAKKRVIGRGPDIPWHLPADFKHFKKTTMGCPIIMGRRTHESIGRPLPGRRNIVVTRHPDALSDEVEGFNSLQSALEDCKKSGCKQLFIIGGAQIYEAALPLANRMYITEVDAELEGDVFFPEVESAEWILLSSTERKKDEKNLYDMNFQEYARI